MKTAWSLENPGRYEKLNTNLGVDVAVVGGGLCGVLTAYSLAKSGKTVALLEQKRLGNNATEFTTAFLTCVIDTELTSLAKLFGKKTAKLVWQSHQDAINFIAKIAEEEAIDCEFNRCRNFMYARDQKEGELLQEEWKTAKSFGFEVEYHQLSKLGFSYYSYLEVKNQAKFHPLKFLHGVVEAAQRYGALIFEQSEVESIIESSKYKVKVGKYEVAADHVVIATYDPLGNPKETKFKKGMYVSYVHEYEVASGTFPEGIYEDMDNPYHYFRVDRAGQKKDRVIFGGEDHREKIQMNKVKNHQALTQSWKEIIGDREYKLVRRWDGPILEPSDGLALIGRFRDNQYVACAFSGNGMTYSGVAASILHDLINNTKNPYTHVYDPTRTPSFKQLWKKGLDYTEELAKGAISNTIKYRN